MTFYIVLVSVSIAMTGTETKSMSERKKDLMNSCIPVTVHYLRKSGQTLTQSRNMEAGADAEAREEFSLFGCSISFPQHAFL